MSAIVDEYIYPWYFPFYFTKKMFIRLGTNEDLNNLFFICFTVWVNIYPINLCLGPKIAFPHLQRSTFKNTYLKYYDFFISEFAKMTIVYLEIVLPFVDNPIRIIVKIFF